MTLPRAITVIGAGLMGHGIAQVFATSAHAVRIYDSSPQTLVTVRSRIADGLREIGADPDLAELVEPFSDLAASVREADFVVEAAIEDLPAKQSLFAAIEAAAPADAILASNTSVIPIGAIMGGLRNRSRCLGTHWWNPPTLVPLVEVVGTEWTAPSVIETTLALHRALGKTAIHVKRDVPGFIGNRLQHALWREAISLVERGICEAQDVDAVVKASFGRRLAVLGPLENADLVGTDLTLAIHRTVLGDIEASPVPSPYLRHLVESGRLGMKAGEGFRSWSPEQAAALRQRVTAHLRAARAAEAHETSPRDLGREGDTP
jgi:3-hydroxybutyryl-CoA dehydrogenase